MITFQIIDNEDATLIGFVQVRNFQDEEKMLDKAYDKAEKIVAKRRPESLTGWGFSILRWTA